MWVGPAVLCISAASLGFELLLMRLLSIAQWHHFAFMIISLALLGFGASGTFLALTRQWTAKRYAESFAANAVLFCLTVPLCFSLAQRVPLNPLEILWDGRQWAYLLEIYLLLMVPFFHAANCLGLTLARFAHRVHRVYFFDLTGAGLGAWGVFPLLFHLVPLDCLKIVSALGFLSAVLVVMGQRKETRSPWALGLILLTGGSLAVGAFLAGPDRVCISEYKGLSRALRAPDARILREATSPLGWLAVVESPGIPFRYAPGLSLNCTGEPPPQLGIFMDGDSMTPVTRYDGNPETVSYLDCLPLALPYHLVNRPKVLVLGAGGGGEVLAALVHGSTAIDAVELDPNLIDLVRTAYGSFSGGLYDHPAVHLHVGDARGYVAGSSKRYDLIQLTLLDAAGASVPGASGLSETYLYTVEAFSEYLKHLEPGGIFSVTRWLQIPPRETLKLIATAVAAMERLGTGDPRHRLALVRSWRTSTLLVKNGPFSQEDIRAIESFCEDRSFDLDYVPGIKPGRQDRFNLLDRPYFEEGMSALLGKDREEFIRRYKFAITPATDDRPYFFHFFKWGSLPEFLSLKQKGGLPLIEWAYPVLLLTLIQALVAGFLLVVLPLFLAGSGRVSMDEPSASSGEGVRQESRNRRGQSRDRVFMGVRTRTLVYFTCLGSAFLFIEITFIQKFILFLHHPLYGATVVLSGMLIFAGLGSVFSEKVACRLRGKTRSWFRWEAVVWVVVLIWGVVLVESVLLPKVFRTCSGLSDQAKMLVSLGLIAPVAFFMGMPFPLGLGLLGKEFPEMIPWAWGVNGCSSVVSAVLATVLAIHLGFNGVMLSAMALYGLGAMTYRNPLVRQPKEEELGRR